MPDKNNLNPINSIQLFALNKYFVDLVRLFKINKFPKVLLLSGEKGIGKFTLSFHLVNYALSQNSEKPYNYEEQKINKESSTYKQILSNTCQNYNYIGNEDQKKTSIEDIRNIKRKFNTSLLNNMPRFIIFDDVELLNINAANSLLKFIEEPSASNYFILINNKKQNVIETIKSRALETKIFLKDSEKNQIFQNLLISHNIEKHFSHEFKKYTTPGKLIQYSESLKKLDINSSTSFYDTAQILFDSYKKTKNQIFLDCINFFLEIKFSTKKNLETQEFLKSVNAKKNLMKLLYNYKKFNLTNNSVLEYIKNSQEHYAQ